VRTPGVCKLTRDPDGPGSVAWTRPHRPGGRRMERSDPSYKGQAGYNPPVPHLRGRSSIRSCPGSDSASGRSAPSHRSVAQCLSSSNPRASDLDQRPECWATNPRVKARPTVTRQLPSVAGRPSVGRRPVLIDRPPSGCSHKLGACRCSPDLCRALGHATDTASRATEEQIEMHSSSLRASP
jgi:hypothetical protein